MVNPRENLNKLIRTGNLDKLLDKAAELHGHYCPGMALGVLAGYRAIKEINQSADGMEDLMVIIETNNCFSDGVQLLTGCTFGNNAMVFRDFGKIAFSIGNRNNYGIRINIRPEAKEYMHNNYPDFTNVYQRVVKDQDHSSEAVKEYKLSGYQKALAIINMDFNKIFTLETQKLQFPDYAPSYESGFCKNCNESVMSSRLNENDICLECENNLFGQLDGHGIRLYETGKYIYPCDIQKNE